MLDSVVRYTPPQGDTTVFGSCESDTGLRYIGFVHGLGGDQTSWVDAENWTTNNYKTNSGRPNYVGWETSFNDVAQALNSGLTVDYNSQFSTTINSRCYLNDYIIGHSQGGIGTRYLDYKWDTQTHNTRYGDRRTIHGLVTFGSTHGGADIGLTKEQHAEFIGQLVSTVVLRGKSKILYDLADNGIGKWFSNKFYAVNEKIDKLIETELVPLALEGVHAKTLDELATGSKTMDSLKNHPSKLHKLAFYGVETAPECWRVIDNMVTKSAEEYDEFDAISDGALIDTMNMILDNHIGEINANNRIIKRNNKLMLASTALAFLPGGLVVKLLSAGALATLTVQNNAKNNENYHRQKSADFLNNANTQWRYLIGSYHVDSVTTITETKHMVKWEEKYKVGSKWSSKEKTNFPEWWDAQAHYNNVNVHRKRNMQLSTYTTTHTFQKFYPSDGVALCKSQMAFPGAPYDHKPISNEKPGESKYEMFGNNHFQERNSPQTKEKLFKLYDGGFGKYWIVEPK
jgi:hypothetical protein